MVPIRAYLAGLAALFVLAAGGAVVYGRMQASHDAQTAAKADAEFAARLAAKELDSGVGLLQSTVANAAGSPGIEKAYETPGDCGLSFGGTDAYTTGHIDLVRQDGSVVCSSQKDTAGGYQRESWLERALTKPLLLAPVNDPLTKERIVLATAPVPNRGFVLAAFDLDGVGAS